MKTFHQWTLIMTVMSLLLLAGCANRTPPESSDIHSRSIPVALPEHIEELAGVWKYKDAAGEGTILLNSEGKGAYEWEGGRFETLALANGTWTGVWIQEGNDREGGFKLTFSDSSSVAEGEWWYTRIGKDTDPLQPGGTFRMSRASTLQMAK